jgi:restriction endonuclease Mrr
VIVTTGTFTRSAAEYVEMSPKVIRLIDGARFVELMVEFAVGVTHEKTVIIPKIDLDYFES